MTNGIQARRCRRDSLPFHRNVALCRYTCHLDTWTARRCRIRL